LRRLINREPAGHFPGRVLSAPYVRRMQFELDIPSLFMPIGVALIGWHFGHELGAGLALVGLWTVSLAVDHWAHPWR
jgi:hypothetical protein